MKKYLKRYGLAFLLALMMLLNLGVTTYAMVGEALVVETQEPETPVEPEIPEVPEGKPEEPKEPEEPEEPEEPKEPEEPEGKPEEPEKPEKPEEKPEKKTYTVRFDSNGGSSISDKKVEEGRTVSEPSDPKRSGYRFDGWYDGSNKYNFSESVNSDLRLKAEWTRVTDKEHTIKFDSNGGSKIDNVKVKDGDRLKEPKEPTKKGYKFDGWYEDSKFKREYRFKDDVEKSFTLYAKWKDDKDSISIDFYVYDDRDKTIRKETSYKTTDKVKALKLSQDILKGDKDDKDRKEIKYSTSRGVFTEIDGIKNKDDYKWEFYINGKKEKDQDADKYEVRDKDKIEWKYVKQEKETVIIPPVVHNTLLNKNSKSPYIKGYDDGTFKPEKNVTREEVATIIYRMLLPDVLAKNQVASSNFTDVKSGRWSESAVATLSNLDLIKGYSDGSFKPTNNITRGEVAVILARANKLSGGGGNSFGDISNYWGKSEVNAVANKGWINGYNDGTFRATQNITRAELVSMMNKCLERRTGNTSGVSNPFADVQESKWYYQDVLRAAKNL